MHTSRDYYYRDGLTSGRCSRVSTVCRSPSPTSHHMCNAYRHSHHNCACPLSTHCTGKSVRFQDEHCTVGRSKSVCRAGYPGSFIDSVSSCYRHSSPVPVSRDFSGDCKTVDYANLSALLRRLSILQIEMKGLLHGKSLKERAQVIGHKLDDDVGALAASTKLNPSKDVWLLEKNSDGNSKKCNKQEQGQATDTCKWNYKREGCSNSPRRFETREHEKQTKPESTSDENQDDPWRERKQIVQLWREYNCDLHLRRIIDSSRREAACRILEKVVHRRLTCYMLQYIAAVAKGLMGDEKTDYLRFFKREGPFRNKPLNEGTYGELLVFVDKQAKPAKDVVKALQISEEGLEEEGGREGFNPYAIGDIRAQMRAFLAVVAATSCGSTSAVAAKGEEEEDFFSTEFLQDLIHAADQGKLGTLQKAQKLVKLACFLSLKCLGFPGPS